jgi:hypothetical protein
MVSPKSHRVFYFITENKTWRREQSMEVVSGVLFGMEERIRAKLIKAGAISHEKAVSAQEADLDMQEANWIHYIAGGMFAAVKKTTNNLYYVRTPN